MAYLTEWPSNQQAPKFLAATSKQLQSGNKLLLSAKQGIVKFIRVSSHTLQFGSCEEQINDATGLFYTEHNKRHVSIT